ncbi:MAG: PrsW family intramembrane metalloprotease [Verrucomicrobiota bacterium]
MPASLNLWQLGGIGIISTLLWLHYVQLKDRHQPEPRRRILLAFLFGVFACGLAWLAFFTLERLGVPGLNPTDHRWTAVYCFLLIGPIEELAKLLPARWFVFRWREYDEPMDGFVYSAAIALGFASVENLLNSTHLNWPEQLARAIALPLTHVLFSAVWGLGISYAHFHLPRSWWRGAWQLGSVLLAMLLHGLYDFLLFAYQATFVTSGLALVLWLVVLWRVRIYANQALASRVALPHN